MPAVPAVSHDRRTGFPLPDPPPQAGEGEEAFARRRVENPTDRATDALKVHPSPACGGGMGWGLARGEKERAP
jgi:hypothetical protein